MNYRLFVTGLLAILVSVCAFNAEAAQAVIQQEDLQMQFEQWTHTHADDDGDGVPNGIDLCPDTKSHLVQLYRAQREEDTEVPGKHIKTVVDGISSDFVLPEYYALTRFVGYKESKAQLWFPKGYEGMHRNGTECRKVTFILNALKDNHKRFPCTDYSIVVFATKDDETGNPEVIYANVHPLVMIPLEWLNDSDPFHEMYRTDRGIYIQTEKNPPENAHEMGIPTGCRIRFPLKKWKVKKTP